MQHEILTKYYVNLNIENEVAMGKKLGLGKVRKNKKSEKNL